MELAFQWDEADRTGDSTQSGRHGTARRKEQEDLRAFPRLAAALGPPAEEGLQGQELRGGLAQPAQPRRAPGDFRTVMVWLHPGQGFLPRWLDSAPS